MREKLWVALLLTAALPAAVCAQPREVSVMSTNRVALAATYFPAPKPGPAAIIFRNCDQDRHSLDAFAARLAGRGVHVVTYDYRNGEAPGMTYAQTRAGDARAVHQWLVAQPGVDSTRLATLGGSCGVQTSLAHARAFAPAVKASIVMSGPATAEDLTFVRTAPWFSVLGVAGRPENSEQNIRPITSASTNPSSRIIVLDERLHGTDMITKSPQVESAAVEWLLSRLGEAPRAR